MGVICDNRQLLDLYLKSRNLDYVKQIMENSYGIIYSTVKNTLRKNGFEEEKCDEYFSCAYIAVVDKIINMKDYTGYDFNFYNYIISHARRAVINEINKEKSRNEREVSIRDLSDKNIISFGLVDDSIDSINKKIDSQLIKKIIFGSKVKLSEHQKEYICLFFGIGGDRPMSVIEIAKLKGVTRQNVQLGITRGFNKIRAYMEKHEEDSKLLRTMRWYDIIKKKI